MINKNKTGIVNHIKNLSTTKLIAFVYCCIILLGALLLTMPIASKTGKFTPPLDALFTATSSTCVTGLIMHDTYTYWSTFGQAVIIVLIQIGGIGFMTLAISALTITKRKIGLKQRFTMQEAIAAPQVGGIVRMTKFIIGGTFLVEGIGAIILSFRMIPKFGIIEGAWFSVFHSISAFCNAGFDLMGKVQPGSSLTTVSTDVVINFVIMSLIIVGGLGFFVWSDLILNKYHFKSYKLHTKIVLTTTAVLLVAGAIILFFTELNKPSTQGKSILEQILNAMFQSVSPRTAGFNTVDLTQITGASQFVIIMLMLIGGSPGSTAGGIKTTTAAVMFLSIRAEFKRRKSLECFKRRIEGEIVRDACCILIIYLLLIFTSATIISTVDSVPIMSSIFEVTSAVGTVGLSLNLTPTLSPISHVILMLLMYIGRVGGITVLLAFANKMSAIPSQLPAEKITVG